MDYKTRRAVWSVLLAAGLPMPVYFAAKLLGSLGGVL
jgi:hypothetical protein